MSLEAMGGPHGKDPGSSKGLPQATWDKLMVEVNRYENRLQTAGSQHRNLESTLLESAAMGQKGQDSWQDTLQQVQKGTRAEITKGLEGAGEAGARRSALGRQAALLAPGVSVRQPAGRKAPGPHGGAALLALTVASKPGTLQEAPGPRSPNHQGQERRSQARAGRQDSDKTRHPNAGVACTARSAPRRPSPSWGLHLSGQSRGTESPAPTWTVVHEGRERMTRQMGQSVSTPGTVVRNTNSATFLYVQKYIEMKLLEKTKCKKVTWVPAPEHVCLRQAAAWPRLPTRLAGDMRRQHMPHQGQHGPGWPDAPGQEQSQGHPLPAQPCRVKAAQWAPGYG